MASTCSCGSSPELKVSSGKYLYRCSACNNLSDVAFSESAARKLWEKVQACDVVCLSCGSGFRLRYEAKSARWFAHCRGCDLNTGALMSMGGALSSWILLNRSGSQHHRAIHFRRKKECMNLV